MTKKRRHIHSKPATAASIPRSSADSMFGIIKSQVPHEANEKHVWREARGLEIVRRRKA
jgi:hypothetical protein